MNNLSDKENMAAHDFAILIKGENAANEMAKALFVVENAIEFNAAEIAEARQMVDDARETLAALHGKISDMPWLSRKAKTATARILFKLLAHTCWSVACDTVAFLACAQHDVVMELCDTDDVFSWMPAKMRGYELAGIKPSYALMDMYQDYLNKTQAALAA